MSFSNIKIVFDSELVAFTDFAQILPSLPMRAAFSFSNQPKIEMLFSSPTPYIFQF